MEILIIYQFCSFGGVERVLLNRAMAFKQAHMDVVISAVYLQDFGALKSFKEYIKLKHLEKQLVPFMLDQRTIKNWNRYDYIFVIDSPQILGQLSSQSNVFLECHTPYIENRQYLKKIPANIKGVLVPSISFQALLQKEFPNLPEIQILPNSVSDEFFNSQAHGEVFAKRPLTYLARIDKLKNFKESLQIFQSIHTRDDVMQMIVGGGVCDRNIISSLKQKHLLGSTLLRDKIGFDQVPSLINAVRSHRGVFISPSKGESFGLSAAEFISGGVPVLLSDIPEHRALVNQDKRFLYPLGDILIATKKLEKILDDWDLMTASMETFAPKFRSDAFLKAWNMIIGTHSDRKKSQSTKNDIANNSIITV